MIINFEHIKDGARQQNSIAGSLHELARLICEKKLHLIHRLDKVCVN